MAMSTDPGNVDPTDTGARGRQRDDYASRTARGVASGFSEASQAFSKEVDDVGGCSDLFGGVMAGVARANARFFDELASVIRRTTDDLEARDRDRDRIKASAIDYERLADLLAARLRQPGAAGPPPTGPATARP